MVAISSSRERITDLLRRNQLATGLYKRAKMVTRRAPNRRVLEQLEEAPYALGPQLTAALQTDPGDLPDVDRQWRTRIERERRRLLRQRIPLDDGTTGPAVPYDIDVTVRRAAQASKPRRPCGLLYQLTRAVEPNSVLELGTNVGISSAYIGAALKANRAGGTVTTLDASPARMRLAKQVHRNLGLDNVAHIEGYFEDTLSTALADRPPVDLAFIDGHHQYQPTLDYFDEILSHCSRDAVLMFDDIRWSDGMTDAWREIQDDDRLGFVIDLTSVGVCVRRDANVAQRVVLDPLFVL